MLYSQQATRSYWKWLNWPRNKGCVRLDKDLTNRIPNRLVIRRPKSGAAINFWLTVLGGALLCVGSGLTLLVLKHWTPGAILSAIGLVAGAAAAIQLSQSQFRLTLSLVEQGVPGEMLVTRQAGHGLPDIVLFSGHMGLLITLQALRDLSEHLVAVPAPGGDFRTISGLLRASHQNVRVVTATAENARLCARLSDGELVVGMDNLERSVSGSIEEIFLSSDGQTPATVEALPLGQDLEGALRSADLLIFGPGSFYTSVVPSFLVPKLPEQLGAASVPKVFICNVMTEPGRTDGWTVADYIENFAKFAGFVPTYTIVNRSYPGSNMLSRYEVTGSYPVMVTPEEHIDSSKVILGTRLGGSTTLNIAGSTVVEADIIEVATEKRLTVDSERGTTSEQTVSVIRHDPDKLARALRSLLPPARGQTASA